MNQDFVVSSDGTKISYLSRGSGKPVIIVPGALTLAEDFAPFGRELAQNFTVYILERRGRGQSGPPGNDYSIGKECEDVRALQQKTGAEFIFGHSFGGLVALETARHNRDFLKVAVYEPGVSIDGAIPIGWAEKCQEQLAQGKNLDAFVTFVRGINPEMSGKIPAWLLKRILPLAIKKAELAQKLNLLPGTIPEHREVARLDNSYPNYREIPTQILLLCGGRPKKSWAERTVSRLAQELPQASMHQFPKFDHFGPEKFPQTVAAEVAAFFLRK